mmetsp:Transcript_66476/g.191905  ORF Transcript_66476/g.191905 Transcript_66476/m.191905 type:complete len:280 (-) Transcript_66476:339-1178(-)
MAARARLRDPPDLLFGVPQQRLLEPLIAKLRVLVQIREDALPIAPCALHRLAERNLGEAARATNLLHLPIAELQLLDVVPARACGSGAGLSGAVLRRLAGFNGLRAILVHVGELGESEHVGGPPPACQLLSQIVRQPSCILFAPMVGNIHGTCVQAVPSGRLAALLCDLAATRRSRGAYSRGAEDADLLRLLGQPPLSPLLLAPLLLPCGLVEPFAGLLGAEEARVDRSTRALTSLLQLGVEALLLFKLQSPLQAVLSQRPAPMFRMHRRRPVGERRGR